MTANATVEVQHYLSEQNIGRLENPLENWERQKVPHLYKLALAFFCMPAFSMTCERIFSKAREVVSKTRNHLKPKTVEKPARICFGHWISHSEPSIKNRKSIPYLFFFLK